MAGFSARRARRHHAKTKKTKKSKTVAGPHRIVLAKGLPPAPPGYLTHQKGDKLIGVKMNREGGKKGRVGVCHPKKRRAKRKSRR